MNDGRIYEYWGKYTILRENGKFYMGWDRACVVSQMRTHNAPATLITYRAFLPCGVQGAL